MCGIAGLIGKRADASVMQRMLLSMEHRGPDGSGWIAVPGGVLGARRLAIAGGLRGHQPVVTPSGAGVVVYNGEAYGLPAGASGPRNDTEWIAELLQRSGPAALSGVDGMFAVAFWDRNSVALARDRYGQKPLYYSADADGLAFASEPDALAEAGVAYDVSNPDRDASFLLTSGIGPGGSWLQNTSVLAPGACVSWPSATTATRFAELAPIDAGDLDEALEAALRESVRRCAQTHSKLGLFVSGGIDSTAIAALLDEAGVEDMSTFSVVLDEDGVRDLAELGLPPHGAWRSWRHTAIPVSAATFASLLPDAVRVMQEPFATTSSVLYLALTRETQRHGIRVVLTGEGADELFGGYSSYLSLGATPFGVDALEEFYAPRAVRDAVAQLLENPRGVDRARDALRADIAGAFRSSPSRALALLELRRSLEPLVLRLDRVTMRHGIEARCPYLQGDVPRLAASIGHDAPVTSRVTKARLRSALARVVPCAVAERPKRPFRAPLLDWLRRPLRSLLSGAGPGADGVRALHGDRVREMLAHFLESPEPAIAGLLFRVLVLGLWKEMRERAAITTPAAR